MTRTSLVNLAQISANGIKEKKNLGHLRGGIRSTKLINDRLNSLVTKLNLTHSLISTWVPLGTKENLYSHSTEKLKNTAAFVSQK